MPNNIVQGEWDWMNQVPGANPSMGMGFPSSAPAQSPGILDRLGSVFPVQDYGGLLGPDAKKAAQRQALLAAASQLMSAGGPSPTRVSFGQALGPALMAGQQAAGQAGQDMLQAMLLKTKLQQKQQPKRYVVKGALVDENGNPIYESPATTGDGIGDYQPGNYTPQSWAKFVKTKNPEDLERYVTPRQEYSPSYQNVTRTLPNGSTQQGTFDTRTGAYNWNGEIVPPGQKARVETDAKTKAEITATREAKAPTAYAAYQAGVKSLESAMAGTSTGPIAGRIPAVTANQQIAEGAEASMAPVLKQLFREAGEGTFTDSDQALLMKMVPTRIDHPEARKAKLEMIDGIVRAKLGIDTSKTASAPATAAPIDVGQTTTINGVKVTRVK